MKLILLSILGAAVVSVAACSSSDSDPAPAVADAGVDASPVDSGAGDAFHVVAACPSTPTLTCDKTQVGSPTDGCDFDVTGCSDGHKHGADCDSKGNCVCLVDGVPDCTCSTGVALCDGGTCACSTNGYCCFDTGGVK